MKQDSILSIINQLHLLETKIRKQPELNSGVRQIDRIKRVFESEGYVIDNPLGEPYDPMRTDLEVNLVGAQGDSLVVSEVVKPVVYVKRGSENNLLQRGVVIVG